MKIIIKNIFIKENVEIGAREYPNNVFTGVNNSCKSCLFILL